MKFKRILALIVALCGITVFAQSVHHAIQSDIIQFGKGGSSSNKELKVNTGSGPRLRYDVAASKWYVSHNGTNFDVAATTTGVETFTNKTLTGNTAASLVNGSGTFNFNSSGTVTAPNGGTLSTLAGAENLTNKAISLSSFDGGTASGTQFVTLPSATIATLQGLARSAGKIYYATDTTLVYFDNGSALLPVGSGQESGFKSYVTNGSFEVDIAGVNSYADAAATTPVDGTGGTATTLTVTRTTTAGEILDGTASLKIAKSAANGQGQGVSIDFVVDRAYLSKGQGLSTLVDASHANYVAGDAVICLYNKDAASLVTLSGADVGACKKVPAGVNEFHATWNATTDNDYRWILHVSTTNASAYNLFVDKVTPSPIILTDGVPVSDEYSYTISAFDGAGTLSITTAYSTAKRVGDMIYISGRANVGAGTGAGTAFRIPLPPGLTIDSSLVSTNSVFKGTAHWFDSSASDDLALQPGFNTSASNTGFTLSRIADNATSVNLLGSDLANGDVLFWNIGPIKVAQWAGSANVVNGPIIECAANTSAWGSDDLTTSNFTNSCLGVQGGTSTPAGIRFFKRIRFQSAKQPGDVYKLQIAGADRSTWVTVPGALRTEGVEGGRYDGTNVIGGLVSGNSASFSEPTDAQVIWGKYYTGVNNDWNTFNTSGGGGAWYWRVVKESGVAARAYAEATTTSPGFVSPTPQRFGGLNGFIGGFFSNEYVGTNPEPGGSSPFTLTSAHKRTQVINPASSIDINLPNDVNAGDEVTIVNRSLFQARVKPSGASNYDHIAYGWARYRALVNNPTGATDWVNVGAYSSPVASGSGAMVGDGSISTPYGNFAFSGFGDNATNRITVWRENGTLRIFVMARINTTAGTSAGAITPPSGLIMDNNVYVLGAGAIGTPVGRATYADDSAQVGYGGSVWSRVADGVLIPYGDNGSARWRFDTNLPVTPGASDVLYFDVSMPVANFRFMESF